MFPKFGKFSKLFTVLSLIVTLATPMCLSVLAQQSTTNPINLKISKVVKDQKDEATKQTTLNVWAYDGELGLDDAIKYGWSGVDLNLKYKEKPAKSGGYLKIYAGDDTTENNLILDYGTSPLPINKLTGKLKDGDNKILFVFIDSNAKATTKVVFTFKFRAASTAPKIEVLQPGPSSVLAKGIDQSFVLKLTNFSLEATPSNQPNKGKLNVYYNEIKAGQNLLQTINFSKDLGNNTAEVNFNTKNVDLVKLKIPDNIASKIIFVLTKSTGELLPYNAELIIQTNYNNSLDVGFPRITIVEPRKDRTDLIIDGERKFILKVDNFIVLPERKDGANEPKEGYLQIFVDETPRKIVFPKTEFSLNELGITDLSEGKKTVRVQLVNKDFTKTVPEATDSVDIIYTSQTDSSKDLTPQVQNNNWRVVIVILTVVLVIGGIAVLITKG
jgi:hypothetical protein